MDTTHVDIDEAALEAARRAVEDCLIDFRDRRVSVPFRGNGFVVRGADGLPSDVIRLSTADGLRIGIRTYLKTMAAR